MLVGTELAEVIETEALPASGVDPAHFWQALSSLIHDLGPRNAELLAVRASLQATIDSWHRQRAGQPHDAAEYRAFLEEIGYLVPAGPDFQIETEGVDPEISTIAGPQLVVPVSNARYAINAANARWGSLYDALYGTDALGTVAPSGAYDTSRGAEVIAWVRAFLDEVAPLSRVDETARSHRDVLAYSVIDGELIASYADERSGGLIDRALLAGYTGRADEPGSILLRTSRARHRDRHRPRPHRRFAPTRPVLPTSISNRR